MAKTGEMIRGVCAGKVKADESMINKLREGIFPDVKEVKCYVNCAFEMMQVVSKMENKIFLTPIV